MRIVSTILLSTLAIYGDSVVDDMDGFGEDEVIVEDSNISTPTKEPLVEGLTGEFTQQIVYSPNSKAPHDDISSLKSSLFLDYEHKFDSGIRVKINGNAYYDTIYRLKGEDDFTPQEIGELESEVELFDAFVEGKIASNFDYKIGRQVVVWGRSDTIRVTDILNPIDNRTPGMVDIEDLRLPVAMAKFDYFVGDWRVTPIAILEQRFSKMPPVGSEFNLIPIDIEDREYNDVSYALSVSGEFSGWDISLYGANTRNDAGYLDMDNPTLGVVHNRVKMAGLALNILTGSWLFKGEFAYFDGLKYSSTGDREFSRDDMLLGVEYNGIVDTTISYDIVRRSIHNYDGILLAQKNPLEKYDYQHAFRVSSEFFNASLKANYLISLYGEKLDEGGFQRL